MILSNEQLKRFLQGTLRHKAYPQTTKLYNDLKVHFDGTTPKDLIDQYRPNESKVIKEYRVANHRAKTKGACNKILSSLSKIRRSQDWNIHYDEKDLSASIKADETLQNYLEKNYPKHASLTNWMFSIGLKSYLIDSNAVVAVIPLNTDGAKSEYLKPEAFVFNSDKVVGYSEDEYCVLEGVAETEYTPDGQYLKAKKIYWVITDEVIQKYEQSDTITEFNLVVNYVHGLKKMPAFKMRGLYKESIDSATIWESRLSSILPDFDQALMTFSDFIAELVQHIHSEKWQYTMNSCDTCNGTGFIIKKQVGFSQQNGKADCPTCNGGKIKTSPYGNMVFNMAMLTQFPNMPTPPAGYLQKDVEVIKELDRLVDKFIYSGLSSLNMEFLAESPLNQSGTAKEVDKDELNNFVHSIAEDIVYIMERISLLVCDYRYSQIVPNEVERYKMLPKINVPEKFDLLGSQYFVDEYSRLKTAGVSANILVELQIEIASKKFYNDPLVAKKTQALFELDPLPGVNNDEKMTMLSNKGITYKDYVVSCYILNFVNRAINEHGAAENKKAFLDMDTEEKENIIYGYADKKLKEIDTAEKLKAELLPPPPPLKPENA